MNVSISSIKGYQLVRIEEDLNSETDMESLESIIIDSINEGRTKVALSFTPSSFLYGKPLRYLIRFSKEIEKSGGHLAIIEPSKNLRDMLETLDFALLTKVYSTEQELGAAKDVAH
ncbi:MAG: hypothetical protein GF401_06630 [Chitinivibrionales bacterium]|nr:hypothetical protein [Chitinivibrionales bacterium]